MATNQNAKEQTLPETQGEKEKQPGKESKEQNRTDRP